MECKIYFKDTIFQSFKVNSLYLTYIFKTVFKWRDLFL